MKVQSIFYVCLSLIISVFLFGCGEDEVTQPETPDCGQHHALTYGPFSATQYTNTYVNSSNFRVFQFSGIPLSSISNICTKTEPNATGSADWNSDTTRPLSIKLVVLVSPVFQPYSASGTITPGTRYHWFGSVLAGLKQAYGEGPGEILDIRVEVSFLSLGNLNDDQFYLNARNFTCDLTLDYDEYRAP